MEEEKIHNKNKFIITLICMILIILLVIGSLFLGKYISDEENKDNNEVNNQGESSEVVESVMPEDYDEKIVYEREEIRKYYDLVFEDSFNLLTEKIPNDIEFVKVDDGQLMWNIDNQWENDSNIANCIHIEIYLDGFDETLFHAYVMSDDYSLYYYQIDNVDALNKYGNQDLSKITIADKNNISVKKIDLLTNLFSLKDENNTLIVAEEIEKVKNGDSIYYIIYDINDRVFSIEESKLTEDLKIKEYQN